MRTSQISVIYEEKDLKKSVFSVKSVSEQFFFAIFALFSVNQFSPQFFGNIIQILIQ